MIFTELGFDIYKNELKGYEFMFAFMPYMHTENKTLQEKGENIFHTHKKLYENKDNNNPSYRPLTNIPEKTNYDKDMKC